jgi:hypothetical protein
MTFEFHVLDPAVLVDHGMHFDVIAAQRIMTLGVAVRAFERPEIPRALAVIEDYFLIQIPQIGHQPKISMTL